MKTCNVPPAQTAALTSQIFCICSLHILEVTHMGDFSRVYTLLIGFGGLGVACWPLVPKFAGSNPAKAIGFLGRKKSSARLPSEGK